MADNNLVDISSVENGLFMDTSVQDQPKGTYPYALNAIHEDDSNTTQGLFNEQSTEKVASISGVVGHTHVAERNQTILFIEDGSIKLFNHQDNSIIDVCQDSEFGCSWGFDNCEHMYAETKHYNHCDELHIYFSSKCVYYKVNIDEMLDPIRKNSVITCEDCTYFEVFSCICAPKLSATPVEYAGSMFEGGAISFSVKLQDDDLNETNFFELSNVVYLGTENNIPGEAAMGGARLHITDLDPRYTKIIIAVVKSVSGVILVEQLPAISVSGKDFTYMYYGQKGVPIDISIITTKHKAFLRGQDLIQKDGRMFYYNLKNERNVNIQKYANQVKLELAEFETTMQQNLKYNYLSLIRGEVYAFGFVYKYCDGTYSDVGHISCSTGGGSTNSSGVLGRSATSAGSADDPGYRPYKAEALDTSNQHQRLRDPDEWQDRPQENDNHEEAIQTDIGNQSTSEQDVIESGECHDNLYSQCDEPPVTNVSIDMCCDGVDPTPTPTPVDGQTPTPVDPNDPPADDRVSVDINTATGSDCESCTEAQEALGSDLPHYSNTAQNHLENLSGYGNDDLDPSVNQTGSLKDAATNLYNEAIKNREYEKETRPKFTFQNGNPLAEGNEVTDNQQTSDDSTELVDFQLDDENDNNVDTPITADSIRGDAWTDSYGNNLTEEPPRLIRTFAPKCWESILEYPDTKDCQGQRFYPEGKIRHPMTPTCAESPHFVSYQNGVVSKFTPENYEYGNTYVRLLGVQFTNIPIPPDDELPKPLCPESPWKFVYVKRTDSNKRVFAKGWLNGVFEGEANGTIYNFPRHGVNSFETVDRHISTGDGGTSRMGSLSTKSAYNFHSPDTDADNSYLPITHIRPELAMRGNGWLHGLYAKGIEPADQWSGTRIDQRGARVSNNLNHYTAASGEDIEVTGLTYAPPHTVIEPPRGVDLPLMNKYRERSVYLQAAANLAGDSVDKSFNGGVLDHYGPTECNAPYAALIRDLPDQYGSVENLKYSDLNIMANRSHATGISTIYGICGDTFIVPYSKKRTSYVSNKVGNEYNVPPKPGSSCRPRNICSSPNDKIFEYTGNNHYATHLPKSGDIYDPKNYAGLHTTTGNCGADGNSKNFTDSANVMRSESDYYFPRTLNSLVCTIVESHVNAWMLESGNKDKGELVYPHLKDWNLDSSAPDEHHWETSYLNQFYCEVEQPSKRQLAKKAAIRTFLTVGIPALGLLRVDNWESVVDTVGGMWTYAPLTALWMLLMNVLFTDKKVDELLGIKRCRTDEEGGDLDDIVKGYSDFYCRYNWDYSKLNDEQLHYAFRSNYNDCDCNGCEKGNCVGQGRELINEIYHSNKQQLDSEIDAYVNVGINQYNELPAHGGYLQKLIVQGGNLYAVTNEGIWGLQFSQGNFPSDIGSQLTGLGELILNPVQLHGGSREGFAGTNYPNSIVNVAGYGTFIVDDIAKKIFRFNGSVEEISTYGVYNFFKEYLSFCEKEGCYDEKLPGSQSYAFGWDGRHNRLLFTKNDGDNSFTISYTPKNAGGGKWISFHTATPYDYFWDRDQLYAIDSIGIHKFHKQGEYGNYLEDSGEFVLEVVARIANYKCFNLSRFELLTRAKSGLTEGIDDTFDSISVNNDQQGTGYLDSNLISQCSGKRNNANKEIQQDYSKIKLTKDCNVWVANGIKDLRVDPCSGSIPLWSQSNKCLPFREPIDSLFDCKVVNSQNMRNRGLKGDYLRYRLKYKKQENRLNYILLRTVSNDPQETT